jgi:HJR/Mrr/RecB family endonuclease
MSQRTREAILPLLFIVMLGFIAGGFVAPPVFRTGSLCAAFGSGVWVVYWFIVILNARDDEAHAALYLREPRGPAVSEESSVNPVPDNVVDLMTATTDVARIAITTDELIQRLRETDWFQFEKIVGMIYSHQGYSVTRRSGVNSDEGIDLLVEKNAEVMAVQCKHWTALNITTRTVRELVGAVAEAGLTQSALVTLTDFTEEAKQLASHHGVQIVNETALRTMLEAMNAATNSSMLAILNDTSKHCPKCESLLVLRTVKKGINAGSSFWGCSDYPRCRYRMQMAAKAA